MVNTLVSPAQVAAVVGTTYADEAVDAAAAAVRNYLGWPVSPRTTRTVVLNGSRSCYLPLPTLDPNAAVTEVRDVRTTEPVVLSSWRKLAVPMLWRAEGWPDEPGSVQVDMTDGFEQCPADLVALVGSVCAELASGATGVLQTLRIDDYSETYGVGSKSGPAQASPYRLPRKTTV